MIGNVVCNDKFVSKCWA